MVKLLNVNISHKVFTMVAYALADFAYKCTYLLQEKNDKDVVSVRHVQRQTVESVVIALIKRNLVERRDLNNVVFIESVGKFTLGKTNFQKAERYVCMYYATVWARYNRIRIQTFSLESLDQLVHNRQITCIHTYFIQVHASTSCCQYITHISINVNVAMQTL